MTALNVLSPRRIGETNHGHYGIFALAAPERLRHLLADAGFNDPQFDQIDVVWPFASFDAYWQYLSGVAGAIAIVLEGLGDADRTRADP